MRKWLIEKLGGFADIESAIVALGKTDNLTLKHQILTKAVKHLFNAVGPEDILRQDENRQWIFQGKPLLDADIAQLTEQAKFLKSSKLWRILKMEIRYQLNVKMFESPNTQNELLWGKLILFYDDVIRKRLQRFE